MQWNGRRIFNTRGGIRGKGILIPFFSLTGYVWDPFFFLHMWFFCMQI